MQNVHDYRLILITLFVACISVLININIVKRLFTANNDNKNRILFIGAFVVGSGLLGLHFLAAIAIPPTTNLIIKHSLAYLSLSWITAIFVGMLTVYLPSKKTLPLSSLLIGSSLCGLSGVTMYYLSIQGMYILPRLELNLGMSIFSVLIGSVFAALYIIVLFWLKNYSDNLILVTKLMFSILTAVCITSIHLIYNATVEITSNSAGVSPNLPLNTLLGICVGLICILFFCMAFIIAIFYEKINFNRTQADSNNELSQLAMLDTLTKLPNRRALQQNLEAGTRRCLRTNTSMAIAFIDLDNFKPVNDGFGHQVGDELLISVANRLNAAVRNCDVVTRIGGDEFVALIEDIKTNADIVQVLERIVHSINEPFFINEHQLFISVSVGVAVFPKDGDIEQLISCADAAMYRAKSDGKNQFRFFDAEIELASDQMLQMQKDLKSALMHDQFKLQFQLKIDSKTQAPVGAEALIRWEHPSKGLMLPDSFIHEAERFGLMDKIGAWVIEETCHTLHRLRQHGIPLNISVNLSVQQLRNSNLAEEIKAILMRYELPTSSIIFEINEAAATKKLDLLSTTSASFRAADLKIAIDNFGANPFNLAYLKNLEISELKLDRQFTSDVSTNHETYAIIEAVIRLAHALQLKVTADGIETESQRKKLAQMGCNYMQGDLFSKPLAEIKLIEMIKQLDSSLKNDDVSFVKDYLHTINNSQAQSSSR